METEEYIDSEGRRWVSPGKVADIWNERARSEGHDSHYTRWSVRQRRKDLSYIQTPLGYLYLESDAHTTKLRARSTRRPDVAKNNKDRGVKREDSKAA